MFSGSQRVSPKRGCQPQQAEGCPNIPTVHLPWRKSQNENAIAGICSVMSPFQVEHTRDDVFAKVGHQSSCYERLDRRLVEPLMDVSVRALSSWINVDSGSNRLCSSVAATIEQAVTLFICSVLALGLYPGDFGKRGFNAGPLADRREPAR
jgi:hypothetical protein